MGLFERFGKWIDRGIVRLIGKPIAALGRKITGVGERIEEKFTPEVVERKKTWRDKAIEAMEDEDIDPGMTDDEIREKYDNNER